MTDFNTGLCSAQLELLALLAEECGEVTQAIGKIVRHGYDSINPLIPDSPTNRDNLERELGDVLAAMSLLFNSGALSKAIVTGHSYEKIFKVQKYLHFQDASATPTNYDKM